MKNEKTANLIYQIEDKKNPKIPDGRLRTHDKECVGGEVRVSASLFHFDSGPFIPEQPYA